MNNRTLCIGGVWLAMLACATVAEPRASAIAVASTNLLHSQRLFVGWYDTATGAGDVQAFDSPAAVNPRWSAAAELQRRRLATPGLPRTVVSAGVAHDRQDGATLAERYGARPMGAVRNANLWYVAGQATPAMRRAMIYAGTNNGMLHGFAADDGSEQLAYVPRRQLAQSDAGRAAVDGPVFGGDASIGLDSEMRSLLVAGLGAGGPGYAVLDVSAPERFASTRVADLVLTDTTDDDDPDIGQLHGSAVLDDGNPNRSRHIVQMANGRWALVIGNGYFSRAGRPTLLVQYLDQARELFRLSPCLTGAPCAHAGDNGLGMPRLLDTDGDGRVDLGYAGDLHGHVWKFELGGPESDWRISRLFTACDAHGRRQPISTAPYARPHPMGGWMVVIGTGRHLRHQDSAVLDIQSLYGLHDRVAAEPLQPSEAACRRPDTLRELAYVAAADAQNLDYYTISSMAQPQDRQHWRGWWIDLPHAGQRVLHNPQGFEGDKLLVRSVAPSGAAQEPRTAGRTWLSVLNLLTGLPPAMSPFALAASTPDAPAPAMVGAPSGPALLFRRPSEAWLHFPDGPDVALQTSTTIGTRAGWREQP